jgi:hypothetical protein
MPDHSAIPPITIRFRRNFLFSYLCLLRIFGESDLDAHTRRIRKFFILSSRCSSCAASYFVYHKFCPSQASRGSLQAAMPRLVPVVGLHSRNASWWKLEIILCSRFPLGCLVSCTLKQFRSNSQTLSSLHYSVSFFCHDSINRTLNLCSNFIKSKVQLTPFSAPVRTKKAQLLVSPQHPKFTSRLTTTAVVRLWIHELDPHWW